MSVVWIDCAVARASGPFAGGPGPDRAHVFRGVRSRTAKSGLVRSPAAHADIAQRAIVAPGAHGRHHGGTRVNRAGTIRPPRCPMTDADLKAAWAAVHDVTPPGWCIVDPTGEERRGDSAHRMGTGACARTLVLAR